MQSITVFGYAWEDIQAAQQGKSLSKPLQKTRSGSALCASCGKYFKLPQVYFDSPESCFPVLCSHCGYAHGADSAKQNFWPS